MFSVSTFLIENQLDVSDRLITSNDKIRKRRRKLRTLLPMTALLSSRGCRKEVSGWCAGLAAMGTRVSGDPAADWTNLSRGPWLEDSASQTPASMTRGRAALYSLLVPTMSLYCQPPQDRENKIGSLAFKSFKEIILLLLDRYLTLYGEHWVCTLDLICTRFHWICVHLT